ncbi:bifunctional riboflavin kinase/FAD synthetase [Magnetospirillum sp. SS-4]|uniref:bifunctional riboflavin kinase/FAD synthetase n=1 Tax=Magnetospirillum sp. SS-4 TaxID=2681465 RepID=UPI001381A24F|nr:bifunctional riboflavin kinase/FAD synthetase [Magnetospirillum sp. SS-4]CAA7612485.1 bifunctional riboflavin kinase and FAD synthetase [Magnetospirillum sp. SS-4]
MRLIRHCGEFNPEHRGCVVALGNFDGVHLGHQAVILTARRIARDMGVPHAVMTFEPHPRTLFHPDQPPFRLTPFRVKARLIEALGIDLLLQQHFDLAFAGITASQFIDEQLVQCLGARHVVVGYDYVFGKGRQGTGAFLQKTGEERGFGVTVVPPETAPSGVIYSSTQVRECLLNARPDDAARLLGHYWEIEGRVEHGDARGRILGFPTANLRLGEYQHPAAGVYAVRAGIDKGGATVWHDGVANFGRRPTFDKTDELLEVHLLDFDEDLYGRHLRVALIEHIRPERKFSGLDELKAQIAADVETGRTLLAGRRFTANAGPMVPVSPNA